jgi:NAD(P)-dependent dehydrogenase (short-subunit alcohol dehydrogenase family)
VVAAAAPPDAADRPDGRSGFHRLPALPADPAGSEALVDSALATLSRLEAMIAIVAASPLTPLDALPQDEWRRRVIAPLAQVFWLVRRVVWEFLASGDGGRIVLVTEPLRAEAAGSSDEDANEVIAASLRALARSIAKEVGSRAVACNVVLATAEAGAVDVAGGGAGAGDPLRPIADAALYLASDQSSFVNGEAITVRIRL